MATGKRPYGHNMKIGEILQSAVLNLLKSGAILSVDEMRERLTKAHFTLRQLNTKTGRCRVEKAMWRLKEKDKVLHVGRNKWRKKHARVEVDAKPLSAYSDNEMRLEMKRRIRLREIALRAELRASEAKTAEIRKKLAACAENRF